MRLTGNTYVVRGDESSRRELERMLAESDIALEGNPDAYVRSYTHFGIDEARDLTARAYGKSVQETRRVFVVFFSVITNEAQNALLKTLEEPPSDALFFLVTPAPSTLLPTLRSRAQVLELALGTETAIDTSKFLKAKPRDRIEMLKPLLDKGDDDRRDIAAVITFLSSLERTLSKMPNVREGIDAIYRARSYAGDKGSLMKPLLEQVALLCPSL